MLDPHIQAAREHLLDLYREAAQARSAYALRPPSVLARVRAVFARPDVGAGGRELDQWPTSSAGDTTSAEPRRPAAAA
ncbi:MAG TPA: hypothetical protein VFS62_04900 [Chloroflexota bacterium]|jgi:hypothetical protein|nr:hypothetical protein [Chloroflexota bacterium]